jgi:hypothetical protein
MGIPIKKPMTGSFPVKRAPMSKVMADVRRDLLALRVNPSTRKSLVRTPKKRTLEDRLRDQARHKAHYQTSFGKEIVDHELTKFLEKTKMVFTSSNALCREFLEVNPTLSRKVVEARIRVGIASGKIPDFRAKNNPFKNKGFVPGKN